MPPVVPKITTYWARTTCPDTPACTPVASAPAAGAFIGATSLSDGRPDARPSGRELMPRLSGGQRVHRPDHVERGRVARVAVRPGDDQDLPRRHAGNGERDGAVAGEHRRDQRDRHSLAAQVDQ